MTKFRKLAVVCQCGQSLAFYHKGGKGRLRKMYFDRIIQDVAGIFEQTPPHPIGSNIHCPNCQKRIGTVQIISGKHAIKINQGVIRL